MSDKGAFIWYELMTDDPAGAKAFYDAVVGWNVQADATPMPTGTEYRMIGRSDGGAAGGVLTIGDDMKRNGAKPGWLGYVHSPDVDADDPSGSWVQLIQDGGRALAPLRAAGLTHEARLLESGERLRDGRFRQRRLACELRPGDRADPPHALEHRALVDRAQQARRARDGRRVDRRGAPAIAQRKVS